MKENYIYPVIIRNLGTSYEAVLPDFDDEITCADDEAGIIQAAQEIIALSLLNCEYESKDVPEPSSIKEIVLDDNEYVVCVQVWLPYYRNMSKEIYVKKTLTIPKWLDMLSKDKNINFSAILVKALKEELQITSR